MDQYELWKQSLSEHDLLFEVTVKDFSNTCVIPGDSEHEPVILKPDARFNVWHETKSYGEAEAQDLRERIVDEPKEQPKKQTRKSPKKDLTNEIQAIKIDEDIFPVMPNYGKISEYGQTWKLRRN